MMANKKLARLGIKRWCYDIPMTMKVFPSNSIHESVRGGGIRYRRKKG